MLVLGVLLRVWCFATPDQVRSTWSGGMANGTRRISLPQVTKNMVQMMVCFTVG